MSLGSQNLRSDGWLNRRILGLMLLTSVLLGAHFAALHSRVDFVGAILVSVLATLGALALVASVMRLVDSWRIERALKRAKTSTSPRHNQLEAFSGQLHVEAQGLASPFSKTQCILYEYDVEPPCGGSDFCGIGMIPSAVRDPRASVRLLGFPVLDHLPKKRLTGPSNQAEANSYLSRRALKQLPRRPASWLKLTNALLRAGQETDGSLQEDWSLGKDLPIDSRSALFERLLEDKQQVTVLGVYLAPEGGVSGQNTRSRSRRAAFAWLTVDSSKLREGQRASPSYGAPSWKASFSSFGF